MLVKLALSYMAGAATVSAVVLATGGTNRTFFLLGFLAAAALTAALGRLLGAARLARWFRVVATINQAPANAPRPASARPTPAPSAGRPRPVAPAAPPSAVEQDVQSALVNLGIKRAAAAAAVERARSLAPQQFEPMFRAAQELCRKAA